MVGELSRILGRNIQAFREAEGSSVETFAARLGMDRLDLEGLERGDADPRLQMVEALGTKLDMEGVLLLQGSVTAREPAA
jgi:transcriptional regulator with XRE-family HTH domain